jgi:hypothetical protein
MILDDEMTVDEEENGMIWFWFISFFVSSWLRTVYLNCRKKVSAQQSRGLKDKNVRIMETSENRYTEIISVNVTCCPGQFVTSSLNESIWSRMDRCGCFVHSSLTQPKWPHFGLSKAGILGWSIGFLWLSKKITFSLLSIHRRIYYNWQGWPRLST